MKTVVKIGCLIVISICQHLIDALTDWPDVDEPLDADEPFVGWHFTTEEEHA